MTYWNNINENENENGNENENENENENGNENGKMAKTTKAAVLLRFFLNNKHLQTF